MKKGVLLLGMLFITVFAHTQDPFIVTLEGIGQYGYVDADAATYTRLNSNTHGNVEKMAARWWADNSEWVYETGGTGCGSGVVALTSNFSHANLANWDAGEKAFVSVYAKYCGGNWNPGNSGVRPDGSIGYNERQFMKVDVNNDSYSGNLTSGVLDNGDYLVGTFVINSGSENLTLDRLWLSNAGTGEEVNDIPNDGIRLYYEAVNGTEEFNGDESNTLIYGDYGSNGTSNNEYGHDDLNISITGGTDLRVYVVIENLNNTFTAGRTVQFSIMNDGISFQETLDGFNQMRIDALDISGSSIPLPVEFTKFNAIPSGNAVALYWQTATEQSNSHFVVEKSTNGTDFRSIGEVQGAGTTAEAQNYSFVDESPNTGANYYRLKQVDFNGTFEYSKAVAVEFNGQEQVTFFPNPVRDELNIKTTANNTNIAIFNMQGQLVRQLSSVNIDGQYSLNMNDLNNGLYFIQITDGATGTLIASKRVVKQ